MWVVGASEEDTADRVRWRQIIRSGNPHATFTLVMCENRAFLKVSRMRILPVVFTLDKHQTTTEQEGRASSFQFLLFTSACPPPTVGRGLM